MKNRQPNGFTLLEVLVVLVLVSLIVSLLFQGISHVAALRARILTQLDSQRNGLLQENWLRGVCSAVIIDPNLAEKSFFGNHHEVRGLSLGPLLGSVGVPTPFVLTVESIRGGVVLRYQENDREKLALGEWRASAGELSFLDKEGKWLPQWPPLAGAGAQLPQAIMLEVMDVKGRQSWVIDVPGDPLPKPTPVFQDLL